MSSMITPRSRTARARRAVSALAAVGVVGVAAYASARASAVYHRHYLTVVECDATPWQGSEPCQAALPQGGWPRSYLIDVAASPGVGTLGPEDTFRAGAFAVDVAVFALLWALVLLVWVGGRVWVRVVAPHARGRSWPLLIPVAALVSTLATGVIHGSYLAEQGNLCRPSSLNPGSCFEELPTAGWPMPYLFDAPGISVTGAVGWAEDDVHGMAFLFDLGLFAVAWTLLALGVRIAREQRRMRSSSRAE